MTIELEDFEKPQCEVCNDKPFKSGYINGIKIITPKPAEATPCPACLKVYKE